MSLLNKRSPEICSRSICVRCNRTVENWIHIWICSENNVTIIQLINVPYDQLKLERTIRKKFHEAIKGLVNKRLLYEINNNLFKDAIKEFELSKGINRNVKRMGNRNGSLINCYGVNEKVKQKFIKDTLDRW
ncbi:hypothetical protein RhiirA5_408266 [Rhizophagus irregularis]|uniref:Uncharacterized protein n=1 Tax=Rhizophagus irregularis TaxID=588596 RepID=A0A2I1F696_9GLOM|nr:hypothetical protein RhiirA5_408266 [Rhizophagus irregularis]PKY29898.1 hypothetical protein RhiirB3_446720 [Rhizophagus irregularis]